MVDSLLEIITERGSHKLYKLIDVHSVTNAIDEIEVQLFLWLHDFSCGETKIPTLL